MKKTIFLTMLMCVCALGAADTFSLDPASAGLISCSRKTLSGSVVNAVPERAGSVLWQFPARSFTAYDRVEISLTGVKGKFDRSSFAFLLRSERKYHHTKFAAPPVISGGNIKLLFDISGTLRENVNVARLYFNCSGMNKGNVSFKIAKVCFFNSADAPPVASADISGASLISCRLPKLEPISNGVVDTIPKDAGSVFIPMTTTGLDKFGTVRVTLNDLSPGLSMTSFALAIRGSDKKYHYGSYAKRPVIKQGKAVLEFTIANLNIKTGDLIRLHINRDKKFTGKNVKLTISGIEFLAKKPQLPPVTALPFQKHNRKWGKTYIFPRTQIKYTLYLNYYSADYRDVWIDRPLLLNRDFTGKLRSYDKAGNQLSFEKEAETALSYADGMGILATSRSYLKRTVDAMDFADRAGIKNFWLPEVSPALTNLSDLSGDADYSFIIELAKKAVSSPSAFRIDGKVVFSSYVANALPPEKWVPIIEELRKVTDNKLIFIAEIRAPFFPAAGKYARNGNKLPVEDIEMLKDFIRSYLDVADGVSFAGCNHIVDNSTDMSGYRFGHEFYKNILLPAFVSVCNEPKYRGKYLGVSAAKGYFYRRNATGGQLEEGTLTLRRSLEAALAVEPDFILMPEWNEANENTHISPTVYDSFASRRVMNHYQHRTEELDKNPELPNLLASYRREIYPGETLTIEILNIPDSRLKADDVTVRLALKDKAGKILHDFGKVTLCNQELSEKRFNIPAEKFIDQRLLIPELQWEMNGKSGKVDGMAAILLDTPPIMNKKFVKHPLRDLCVPVKSELKWNADNGVVSVKGSIDAGKTISSIELLANTYPVDALDVHGEYKCGSDEQMVTLIWSSSVPMREQLKIRNLKGSSETIDDKSIHMSEISRSAAKKQSWGITKNLRFSKNQEQFIFKTSKDAVLEISAGKNKFTVSVADIVRLKEYRKIFPDSMCFMLEPKEQTFVVPYPVGKNSADFTLKTAKLDPGAVYSVRLITSDGGIWNSAPFYPQKLSGKQSDIVFWSFADGKPRSGKIPVEYTRTVDYDFNTGAGDLLPAFTRMYSAYPGGSDRYSHNMLGKSATNSAPSWEKVDGRNVLKFDGKNNYLRIPTPLISEQTLRIKFSINPADNSDRNIFNGGYDMVPALCCNLKNGVLYGEYRNRNGKLFYFTSEKCVTPGKWNDIEFRYDMSNITLFCNGRQVAKVPCNGLLYKQPALIFGGHDSPKQPPRFKGLLRQISVSNVLN